MLTRHTSSSSISSTSNRCQTDQKMLFWPQAYKELCATIGSQLPETGGLLFGDRSGPDAYIVKKFVFDTSGKRSHVSYDPDPDVVNAIIKKVWAEEGLALIGWAHSHPRGVKYLSGDYGNGTGDIGYLRSIFQAIPALEKFLVPIIHSRADGPLTIYPYIAYRNEISNYREVKIAICHPEKGSAAPASKDKKPQIQSNPKGLYDPQILSDKIDGAVDPNLMASSKIFAVGAGGANGIYENLMRMGLGHLTIMDFDRVDASNLVTQGWFADQIGSSKVQAFRANAQRFLHDKGQISRHLSCLNADMLKMDEASLIAQAKDADLLMFMTDDFYAQARGNRLALKLQKPAIFAMMYEGAGCAEITFTIPGVTPACHRCAVSPRYQAYLKQGFVNKVGSQGSCIIQTQMLNSLIGLLSLAILHRDTQGYEFSGWFGARWTRNLIQARLSPHHTSGLFERILGPVDHAVSFDSIWQEIEPEAPPKYERCPDCGGTGDLRQAKISSTHVPSF